MLASEWVPQGTRRGALALPRVRVRVGAAAGWECERWVLGFPAEVGTGWGQNRVSTVGLVVRSYVRGGTTPDSNP